MLPEDCMELTLSKQMGAGYQTVDSKRNQVFDLGCEVIHVVRTKDSALFAQAFDLFEEATRIQAANWAD